MNRRILRLVLLGIWIACAPALASTSGASGAIESATPGAAPARFKRVTLHVFNRVFSNFHQKAVAVPNREFRVGDTEYSARIIRFEPDFTLDTKSRKVRSRSGEPRNPAFQIVVSRAGSPRDTTWAFFNMPPHFGVREELAFVATEIVFVNRPSLVSQDSIAVRIRNQEEGAH